MTIDEILDNITEYQDNIDDFVHSLRRCNINDFTEFKSAVRTWGGAVPKSLQDRISDAFTKSDDKDWEKALASDSIEIYDDYLKRNPDGKFRNEARQKIEVLERNAVSEKSDSLWEKVDKADMESLRGFIAKNPTSKYVDEAKRYLRDLQHDKYIGFDINVLRSQINTVAVRNDINNPASAICDLIETKVRAGKITADDLLDEMAKDNNFLSSQVVRLLWENGIITDFDKTQIDKQFIAAMIEGKTAQQFDVPAPIDEISKPLCTEVYFWGIPSSGKTCALGAILNAASSGQVALTMRQDECQGYGYMTKLIHLFDTTSNSKVSVLPAGTPKNATYEMAFMLEDRQRREHHITCIDIAGEMIRCMYKYDANEPLQKDEMEVLDTLTKILKDNRTGNRKIHFFVMEYEGEDREYEGLTQKAYLNAAVAYIDRTGIFEKDTDGIYLLVSKADKIEAENKKDLETKVVNYIKENYRGFYSGLQDICKRNDIKNMGTLPFSIGKVCFQNFCKFDPKDANIIVEELLERSRSVKPGKRQKFLNKLSK